MCGIVGVALRQRAQEDLLEGLRRLEYRGYDSAGLALQIEGANQRWRAKGKVADLEAVLPEAPSGPALGIAHTRWATHGQPSVVNAHPHQAGRVCLVHNGIIENFKDLRAFLIDQGCNLESETDSEVIAHLINLKLEQGLAPFEAFQKTVDELEGAFALAAMVEGEDAAIYGARRGAPMVVGLSSQGHFLASDVLAFAGKVERVIYLDEGDKVCLKQQSFEVFNSEGERVERIDHPATMAAFQVDKGPYRHFMEKEIHEQSEVIGRTLSHYIDAVEAKVRTQDGVDFANMDRLSIIGCGTASYAGRVAEYWFEKYAKLAVEVDIASEFRYREPAFIPRDAALFISQSGETADTLEAMRLSQKAGVFSIALVNSPNSSMAREADLVLPILAGPEIGVASTKAFTCQISALAALAVLAAKQRGHISDQAERDFVDILMGIPGLITEALESEGDIIKIAHEIAQTQTVLYLGRDQYYPMALEGALKLKEISYIHAEGYAAGELKHGPIALIEEGVDVIVLAPHDDLFDKTRSSIEQVKSRGARVIVLTDEAGRKALDDPDLLILNVPSSASIAGPLAVAVGVQLLAYHVAVHKGTDVDQPRNLAKSVTVE